MTPPVTGQFGPFSRYRRHLARHGAHARCGGGAARSAAVADQASCRVCRARWLLSAAARSSAIDRLFAPLRTAAIGCHGAEVRGADGKVRALAAPMPDARARTCFAAWRERYPGILLEDKIYALALHYRLAPEARPAWKRRWKSMPAAVRGRENRHLHAGKAVIEAQAAGHRQGRGRARPDARRRRFAAARLLFGGDDTTDLDVFQHPAANWAARLFGGPAFHGRGLCLSIAARGAAMADPSGRAGRGGMTPPQALDLAVIGNGRTAALVDTNGADGLVVLSRASTAIRCSAA